MIPRTLNADLALWSCVLAFGPPDPESPGRLPWARLGPEWGSRMEGEAEPPGDEDPDDALSRLRSSHRAQARVDRGRVHPTWWARASQDESPAVRAILDGGPEAAGDPQVLEWVRALVTERLVGGEPIAANDPPAIVALAGLPSRGLHRLARTIGEAKLALAGGPDEPAQGPPARRDRRRWFRERLTARIDSDEETLREWAGREVQRASASAPAPRRLRAYLGVITLARLLAGCEPFRVRWALQHLPYPIAKRFRSIIASSAHGHPGLYGLEQVLLKTAWERLTLEGRGAVPYPADETRTSHVP